MNAAIRTIESTVPDPGATCHAAIAARAQALRTVDECELIAVRARETVAAAKVEADKYADEEAASITRHQKRLSDWVVAGNHGSPPVVVPNERSVIAKRSADVTYQAAVLMLADLEATAARARSDLIRADRAVAAAIASLRPAEIAAAEQECLALLGQFARHFSDIHARSEIYGDDVHDTNAVHQRLKCVFNAVLYSAGGDWSVPANQRGNNAPVLVEAREKLAQRDARLIAGESNEQTER